MLLISHHVRNVILYGVFWAFIKDLNIIISSVIYEWKLSLSLETVIATEDGVKILKLKTFIREDEIVFYNFWLFFMLDTIIIVFKVIDCEYLFQVVKCLWSLKIDGTSIQIVVEVAVEALLIVLNDAEAVSS